MKKFFKWFCLFMCIGSLVNIPIQMQQFDASIETTIPLVIIALIFGLGFIKLNKKQKEVNDSSITVESKIESNQTFNEYSNDSNVDDDNYKEPGSSIKTSFDINEPRENVVRCPKCGCTSIITTNKKLSLKRAALGTALLNPLAGAVGAVTSKKMYNVCQKCGYRWELKQK